MAKLPSIEDTLSEIVDAYDGPVTVVREGKKGARPKKAAGNQNAGRPAKAGERFPSGDLKPGIAPAELARVRTAVMRGLLDPKFGSQVGTLLLTRQLTPEQSANAFRVGEIYGRFEMTHGLRRSTKSPSYESGISTASRISIDQMDEEAAALEEQRLLDIEAAWLAVQDWLSDYNKEERAQLERLCVDDLALPAHLLPDVAKMLDRLGKFLSTAKARGKKRKKKKPALMLVTKDMRAAPKPAMVRRADQEREAFLKMQRILNPKLTDAQLNEAYGIFVALKDRGSFRNDKQR